MRKTTKISLIVVLLIVVGYFAKAHFFALINKSQFSGNEVKNISSVDDIQDGDLIFQTSLSGQSKAIQLATKSSYSHCGIIFKNGGKFYVYEAVQPVKYTPIEKWIARGEKGHFVIKRLKNANVILTENAIQKMKQIGEKFIGKDYDLTFDWTDDKIYCSELIWKIYQRATGVEIGKLEKLKDFDLSSPVVKAKLKERYGNKLPLDETVISPKAIFESELLTTIKSN